MKLFIWDVIQNSDGLKLGDAMYVADSQTEAWKEVRDCFESPVYYPADHVLSC